MHPSPARSLGKMPRLAWLGRLCALVALAVQLGAASIVPLAVASNAGPERLLAAPICHAAGGSPAPRQGHDCVLCPLCQAVAHAGAVLGPTLASVPPPVLVLLRAAPLPPARAPPLGGTAVASYPRGPPVLV
jgi:hypothetical protein